LRRWYARLVKTRIHYALLGAIALGCSAPQTDAEGPVVTAATTEPGSAPVDATAGPPSPPPTSSVPSTATLPTSSIAPAPKAVIEERFLPIDLRCEKDADCAVTKRGVSVPLFCCDACDAVAGGRAWVARADLRCSVYDKETVHHSCPPRDCAAPRGARCNHGACELVL
jgi:hypothetical protein